MCINLRIIGLFVLGLSNLLQSKVIIKFRVYNYQNPQDVKHDGTRCENFYWLKDHCDPMFHVCVTSRSGCDIVNSSVDHWKNKKYVHNVLSKTIILDNIQRSFEVRIQVDDHDRFDSHDHIAVFRSRFNLQKFNYYYVKKLTVEPRLNVQLYASLTMYCQPSFYGNNCDQFCEPKPFNYNCNMNTGKKICTLQCGRHGGCSWTGEKYKCKCNDGWTGEICQFKHYDNCSKLSCITKCQFSERYKFCECAYSLYVETCREILNITTTKRLTTSTKTTTITEEAITTEELTTTEEPTTTKKPTTIKELITIKDCTTNKEQTSTNEKTKIEVTTQKEKSVTLPKRTENIENNMHTSEVDIIKEVTTGYTKESVNQPLVTFQQISYSPTTIVIICLLILLCICVISLVIVIQSWKKKDKTKNTGLFYQSNVQRPLPAVIYKPNTPNNKRVSSIYSNASLPDTPEFEYDTCTIQTDYNYEISLIKLPVDVCKEETDTYEEPIANNKDIMTCNTDLGSIEDDDSVQYEEPKKI